MKTEIHLEELFGGEGALAGTFDRVTRKLDIALHA